MDEIKKALEEITKSFQKMLEEKEGKDYKILEGGEEVRIEIDMPGLEPGDISLSISRDGTYIRAEGARGDRRYLKHVKLPFRLDPTTARAAYRQGILTIFAKKYIEEEIKIRVE
ncbi:MAG: Hsp20/alpha crystallin family protein [Pyrobaculum sp.]